MHANAASSPITSPITTSYVADGGGGRLFPPPIGIVTPPGAALLHYAFPSQEDTLAYVDALKHSDLSQWRSLEEVAARAGGGSCDGAVTTSVLTALYLLGLFSLCATSPTSCCVPPVAAARRRRHVDTSLPPLIQSLQQNLSTLSLDQFRGLPHVDTPGGEMVPVHVSVVEQVKQLWDSNPRLLSNMPCRSATESVRSSFISLSGVASGIILAYSVAQLNQCYPDQAPRTSPPPSSVPNIWFFPVPKTNRKSETTYLVPSASPYIPVPGDDEPSDGCERSDVLLEDGRCAPLLSPLHCPYHHWVLLNKQNRLGECVPRLCGEGRIYVEKDQLCHDIHETGLCPDSQRLYIDAFGESVCDCPDGLFQGPDGQCYVLYDPAYCTQDNVLQFHQASKTLMCGKDPCGHVNANLWPNDLPFAPREDGFCYQFNEQGPCEVGERFGFDTESLRAQCVSLLDAGLMRPKRSYMYHHMSFPSSPNQPSPHYQVSYVILNGSTWGLEVKGVGREKRQTEESSNLERLYFIDTRDIPTRLEVFLTNLYSPKNESNIDEASEYTEIDCSGADIDYERCFYDTDDEYMNDGSGILVDGEEDYSSGYFETGKLVDSKDQTDILSNDDATEQNNATHFPSRLTKKELVQRLLRLTTEDNNKNNNTIQTQRPSYSIDDIFKKIVSPGLRIVDTTKPSLTVQQRKSQPGTFTTSLFDEQPKMITELTTQMSTTNNMNLLTQVSEGEVLKVDQTESIAITDIKQTSQPESTPPSFHHTPHEIIKVDQNQVSKISSKFTTEKFTQIPTTPKNRVKIVTTPPTNNGFGENSLGTNIINTDNRKRRIVIRRRIRNKRINLPTNRNNSGRNNKRRLAIIRRNRRKGHFRKRRRGRRRRKLTNRRKQPIIRRRKNRKNRNKITIINNKINNPPIIAQTTTIQNKTRQNEVNIQDRQEIVNTSQSQIYNSSTTSRSVDSNSENFRTILQTETKSNSSEPNLHSDMFIYKMNNTNLANIKTNNTSMNQNNTEVIEIKHDVAKSNCSDTTDSALLTTESYNVVTTNDKASNNQTDEVFNISEHVNRNTSNVNNYSENRKSSNRKGGWFGSSRIRHPNSIGYPFASLPDYLRHRDRRQLTGGGGIIQAPLLSACKPGAKRDYNYKCRPMFIPQERSRRASDDSAEKVASPVKPRIKCPEGTQLDPRGKCQAASSLLG